MRVVIVATALLISTVPIFFDGGSISDACIRGRRGSRFSCNSIHAPAYRDLQICCPIWDSPSRPTALHCCGFAPGGDTICPYVMAPDGTAVYFGDVVTADSGDGSWTSYFHDENELPDSSSLLLQVLDFDAYDNFVEEDAGFTTNNTSNQDCGSADCNCARPVRYSNLPKQRANAGVNSIDHVCDDNGNDRSVYLKGVHKHIHIKGTADPSKGWVCGILTSSSYAMGKMAKIAQNGQYDIVIPVRECPFGSQLVFVSTREKNGAKESGRIVIGP